MSEKKFRSADWVKIAASWADYTIDVELQDSVKRVKTLTDGGAYVVIDVSACATQPVRDALDMVKPGGAIVLAGVKGMKSVDNFISDLIVLKEINIKGTIGVTSTGYKSAINLIESGRVDFQKMHTHEFELADADLAIRTLGREVDGEGSIHSCLIPPRETAASKTYSTNSEIRKHG